MSNVTQQLIHPPRSSAGLIAYLDTNVFHAMGTGTPKGATSNLLHRAVHNGEIAIPASMVTLVRLLTNDDL